MIKENPMMLKSLNVHDHDVRLLIVYSPENEKEKKSGKYQKGNQKKLNPSINMGVHLSYFI